MKKLLLSALISTALFSNMAFAETSPKIHHLPKHIKSYDELIQKTTPTANLNPKSYYEFEFELVDVPQNLELISVNGNYWANCWYSLHSIGIESAKPFYPSSKITINTIQKISDNHYTVRIYDDHWQNQDYLKNGVVCEWQLNQGEFVFAQKDNPNHSIAVYQFNHHDYKKWLKQNHLPNALYFDKQSYDTPSIKQHNPHTNKMVTDIKEHKPSFNVYQMRMNIKTVNLK